MNRKEIDIGNEVFILIEVEKEIGKGDMIDGIKEVRGVLKILKS